MRRNVWERVGDIPALLEQAVKDTIHAMCRVDREEIAKLERNFLLHTIVYVQVWAKTFSILYERKSKIEHTSR